MSSTSCASRLDPAWLAPHFLCTDTTTTVSNHLTLSSEFFLLHLLVLVLLLISSYFINTDSLRLQTDRILYSSKWGKENFPKRKKKRRKLEMTGRGGYY